EPAAAVPNAVPEFVVLGGVTGSSPLANGIEIKSGDAVMRITALRDDVLRVRVGAHGQLPEDASWAVLPASRTQSVPVSQDADADSLGFRTRMLRVRVERST